MRTDKLGWIKMQCLKKRISLKQLTAKMEIDYSTFIQQINGFKNTPDGLAEKVRKALKEW